jgi:hypothetical protein
MVDDMSVFLSPEMKRPREFPLGAFGIPAASDQRAREPKAPTGLVFSVFLIVARIMGREM